MKVGAQVYAEELEPGTPEARMRALDHMGIKFTTKVFPGVQGVAIIVAEADVPAVLDALAHRAAAPGEAVALVNAQAEDDGLWFVAQTITEDYLQRALRELHAAVERDAPQPAATPQRPTLDDVLAELKSVRAAANAPQPADAEWCANCGNKREDCGCLNYRAAATEPTDKCNRCDDTGCSECDPEWAEHQVRASPEQEAALDRAVPRKTEAAQGGVSREPTDIMLLAGNRIAASAFHEGGQASAYDIWQAMYDATPSATEGGGT